MKKGQERFIHPLGTRLKLLLVVSFLPYMLQGYNPLLLLVPLVLLLRSSEYLAGALTVRVYRFYSLVLFYFLTHHILLHGRTTSLSHHINILLHRASQHHQKQSFVTSFITSLYSLVFASYQLPLLISCLPRSTKHAAPRLTVLHRLGGLEHLKGGKVGSGGKGCMKRHR